ncbi:MAG: AAA family ATPase [Tenericutes bacterium]|nr:AAA family ATPase [Mycoplasmatota bacterium]
MNIEPEQLKQEEEYLKKTLAVIKELIENDDNSIKDRMAEIQEMKKYLWDNNAMLDDAEIASGMYNVNCDVSYTNENIKKLMKLKKSLESPYFGRVDFESNGFSEPVYIGINSIAKDLTFYVFDWRTPIASLFYNYGTGPASYEAPRGTISGNISLKRQYKISDEKIERCFNSDLNIDDEYLQEILANASSEKMTNIVNTIQREQNEIIRNVSDKYLIVQGIAGSGKTSVALHRIAYLLYKEKNLSSNNVLIFSPNDVFSQYISNVLPELGEDNVLQTTFSDFASAYIRDFKEIESFTQFIERYYKSDSISEEEYKTTKYKISDEFKSLIDNYIERYRENMSFIRPIIINGKAIKIADLNRLLKTTFGKFPLSERIDRISEYICDHNNISYKKYGKTIREKIKTIVNFDLDVKKMYEDIISSDQFKECAGLKENAGFKVGKQLKYDDLLPLMYIYFEMNGYPKNNSIRHVIIDEAQDYSLLQFYMLKKIFYTASFTVLGDIHQTINPYYIYNNLNDVNSIFENKGKYIELNKTYRSSQEIIEFTNQILGLDNACSVRKNNAIPVTMRSVPKEQAVNQIMQDIEIMRENGIKRIAIITKNNTETLELYDKLKDQLDDINIIQQNAKAGIGNMVILPSYISKGLEFDGVIAYTDEDHEYQEKDKYLFYVVCTRAQHNLTVYNQKTLKLERKK